MASPGAALVVLLAFQYGFAGVSSECGNATQFSTQIDLLLAEYDREAPPAAKVLVTVMLDVRHATINEADSSVRLLADLKLSWVDPRVTWNASDWGCESALSPAERLWLPDVAALNAASTAGDVQRARLSSTGGIAWISRLELTAPIALTLRDWPEDFQLATFKFASREHTLDELDLDINEFIHAVVFEAGAWEIASVRGSVSARERGGARSRVAEWQVRLRRRAAAHAAVTSSVLAAAVLLLAAAAALPPGEREPLAATASLVTALWLTAALVRLPGAAACPAAVAALGAACGAGGALCAAAAGVRAVSRCAAPPPHLLRGLLSALSVSCNLTPDQESPGAAGAAGGAWAAAARLLDRVLMGLLALTLLVLVAVYTL